MKNVVSLSLLTVLALSMSIPAVMAQASSADMGFAPTFTGHTGSTSDAVSGQTGSSGAAFSNFKEPEWVNYDTSSRANQWLIPQRGPGLTKKTEDKVLQDNLVQQPTGTAVLAPNSVSNKGFEAGYSLGFKALGSQLQVNPSTSGVGLFGPALLPATGTGSVNADITNGYF